MIRSDKAGTCGLDGDTTGISFGLSPYLTHSRNQEAQFMNPAPLTVISAMILGPPKVSLLFVLMCPQRNGLGTLSCTSSCANYPNISSWVQGEIQGVDFMALGPLKRGDLLNWIMWSRNPYHSIVWSIKIQAS
jgi:hypothetical protein